jgi:hypothetical protein
MQMKFANPFFPGRPTEKLDIPVLIFVGEQDGPPERLLKGKLSALLDGHGNVLRAYLARAQYGNSKNILACLCLGVTGGADEPLVEAGHSLFAQHFNRAVHLDIVFPSLEQEEQLALVCKPFYERE